MNGFFRRAIAGFMTAVTVVTTVATGVPIAFAADEDNTASTVEIKKGEVYNIYDKGVDKAWFQQNGSPRNVWPMYTKASDNSEIRAYCADHSKANPGTSGTSYTVTGKVSDMHVYGVATQTDSRMTRNAFVGQDSVKSVLNTGNFTDAMYFSASQAALWAALGEVQIAANSKFGVTYTSSTALGYRASGKTLSASTASEALTLYAAIKMLEYGNTFYQVWGPSGKGHEPWVSTTLRYTPGSATYSGANSRCDSVTLTNGIIGSNVFAEKTIDGQTYMVLSMAATSSTFVRGNRIFVSATNMPTGSFLMDSQGNKSGSDGRLTLSKVKNDSSIYPNQNGMAFGEELWLCIPKTTAEQMDAAKQKLSTAFLISMNVDRYNVYVASPKASGVQPVVMVEPGVIAKASRLTINNPDLTEDKVNLKILKSDKDGGALQDCTFQISYRQSTPVSKTTDSNGEVEFKGLPTDTDVTIKETSAPEGYTLLPAKTINTGSKNQTIELKMVNGSDHTFKIHKISSADGRNLPGATFEVKGIDTDYHKTFTTNALGEIEIQGRDLPKGSYEVYEVAAPTGYMTDGSDIKTFEWTNTKDIEMSFKDAPNPAIQIYKYDKDSKMPLEGATFEVRKDGQVLATLKTNVNGYATIDNLTKGFYQVVETAAPAGYLLDEQVHEVYIDPTADPTQLIREVNVPNTKKLAIRIIKIDKESKVPLANWKFDVYYNDAHLTSVTTDENGEAMLNDLQPGTYRVSETGGDTTRYNMDAPDQTIELVKDQAEIPTLTFENTPKTDFSIYKIDSETKRPIEGVTFEILKDGKSLGNYTTDKTGRIWLPFAEPGTYQAKETITDPRYVLNETTFTIENNSTYPSNIIVPNVMKKDITVKKIDKDTGAPLQGVVFQGFRDGKSIGYFTTGADGKFTIPYADSGTYIFKEYHTLAGYVLSKEPVVIEHTTNGNVDIIVDNTVQKNFTVVKVDSQTKQPLPGVQFKIWRDGVLLGDYTSDENGKIVIEKAPAGTYKVQETATLKEYILNDKPYEIEHTTDKATSITIENTKKPGLSITKIDAETKKPLANAVFKLTRANGDVVKEDIRTGEDGTAFVEGLDAADYIVTEVTAPGGYIIDKTPHAVSLEEGKTYTLTVENSKKPGLLIKKVDSETHKALSGATFKIARGDGSVVREAAVTDSDGIIHLAELDTGTYVITEVKAPDGYVIDETPKTVQLRKDQTYEVTFENTQQSGLVIKKIDEETRQPLKNAQFRITKSNGELVKEAETDENGTITLNGLPDCSLIITEIKAPTGYILQDTPKTIEVKAGGNYELTFTNKKSYGLQIRKVEKGSGTALPGAKFKVEKVNGERIGEYTTNSSGLINISGLEDGVYVVTETKAPDGYRIDTTPQNVIVKAGELATVEFENTKMSSVRIKKIDAVTKDPIPGVRFLIKDHNKNIVGEYTTDSDGYIELEKDLEEGKYYAEEIQAAQGYIRDTQERTFRVKKGETTEIVWENTAQYGQIQIIKKSKEYNSINGLPAGTLLEGATFEIYDKANNVVDTIVSNSRGLAISKLLPLGRYTIRETKAPAYYGVADQDFTAEIEFASQIVKLEVLDSSEYTNVSIAKSGPKQVTPNMQFKWTISKVANNSTTRLNSFYWRDTLPYTAVQLDKIVTGTYNTRISYKVVYRTNLNRNYRTLADNIDSTQSRTLIASPTALGLKSGEAVTDIMFVFGTVPAGFRMVNNATIFATVRNSYGGSSFVNKADVGGLNSSQQWIMSNDAWTTTIYRKPIYTKPTLPTTGW